MKEIVIMRFILSVLMLLASMLASIGAVNYPARTNGNNTFYGTNRHVGPVIIGNTNQIANEGSSINNAKFTNGVIRATQGIFSSSVNSSGLVSGDTVAAATSLDTPILVFGTTSEAAMINPSQRMVSFVDQNADDRVTVTLSNLTASGKVSAYGIIIKSNTIAKIPTLTFGDNFYWSSNGVPHIIWKDQAGTQATNRLVP